MNPFVIIAIALAIAWLARRIFFPPHPQVKLVETPKIIDHPSPNFGDRKTPGPSMIVLHYTAMETTQAALDRLCDPKSEVSSHYLVGEDGTIYRLVQEDKRAWHAGVSYWQGGTDINSLSIGIEIANQGDRPYTEAQNAAVQDLCAWILSRYDISPVRVVGHCDVAPGRKQDPGFFFPWQNLAAAGIGYWKEPTSDDYKFTAKWGEAEIRSALNRYGYDPNADLKSVLDAFQRHFQQGLAQSPGKVGTADKETAARLCALTRELL
ncbi:MAG TPA: N-acetylmuramoyl-L-alanine amidase [Planktothrix sp.]|jgi:N-acetylmuramoyl-L-alanine amidase